MSEVSVHDGILDEEQAAKLREEVDGLRFATVAYNTEAELPLVLDPARGVAVGRVETRIVIDGPWEGRR